MAETFHTSFEAFKEAEGQEHRASPRIKGASGVSPYTRGGQIAVNPGQSVDWLEPGSERGLLRDGLVWIEARLCGVMASTVGAPGNSPASVKQLIDRLKVHYGNYSRRRDAKAIWVEVVEYLPGVHSHVVFGVERGDAAGLLRSLQASPMFVSAGVHTARVRGFGAVEEYLKKYLDMPLPEGSPSRVRVSRDLRDELASAGVVVTVRNSRPSRCTESKADAPSATAVRALGSPEGGLFGAGLPIMSAPTKAKRIPRRRLKHEPLSLPLELPPSLADVLPSLGMTHQQIAERVGLSRPTITNILNARFGLGRAAARRVFDLARAA